MGSSSTMHAPRRIGAEEPATRAALLDAAGPLRRRSAGVP
jgi:hypothetical protein